MKFDLLGAIKHLDRELGVGKARLEINTIDIGIEIRICTLSDGTTFSESFIILNEELNDNFISVMGLKFHRAVMSLKRSIL